MEENNNYHLTFSDIYMMYSHITSLFHVRKYLMKTVTMISRVYFP